MGVVESLFGGGRRRRETTPVAQPIQPVEPEAPTAVEEEEEPQRRRGRQLLISTSPRGVLNRAPVGRRGVLGNV